MRSLLSLMFVSVACSRAPAEIATKTTNAVATSPDSSPAAPSSSAALSARADAGGDADPTVELPLLWNDPPSFKRITPKTPARAAEYLVPRAGKDPEDAECVVMTFGARHGGTINENVKRWVDQFHPVLGAPRRMDVEINGMRATFIEVAGTFAGNVMPNREGLSSPPSKPAWRLIGAIIEAPSGLWFFKLIGPDLTVRIGSRPFEDMVRSARPR
jgi:hypothetical protein